MAERLGDVVLEIWTDEKRLDRGLKRARDKTGRFVKEGSASVNRFGASLGSVGKIAGGLGAVFGGIQIASVIGDWIQAANEFELEMANVSTLVDTSVVDMAGLEEGILSLGGSLGSSTELAQGLYQALSAGVEPAKAVEFVGEAAKFAKAGLTDTKSAVDVLTTAINAYGLSADDATSISDTLFTTVRLGKTTADELAGGFGRVIGTAASVGISFEELNAAVATLTSGGIATGETMSSLKAVIANIAKPTKDAEDAANRLGIEFDIAALQSKGFAGFLGDLTQAAADDTQAQLDLFGSVEAFNAVAILASEQGAKKFTNAMAEMADKAGATNDAFEKQTSTLSFQMTTLWNNLSGLFTEASKSGGALASVLTGITESLKSINEMLESARDPDDFLDRMNRGVEALGKAEEIKSAAAASDKKWFERIPILSGLVDAMTGSIVRQQEALGEQIRKINETRQETAALVEKLKEQGIEIARGSLSWEKWSEEVHAAAAELEAAKDSTDEVNNATDNLNTTLNTLTESQRELAERLKDLQALPKEVAEQIAFLERAGFSAEQQFALLSGELDELVRASELVELQIPDSAQELIEFGEAAQASQEQFHDSFAQIGDSIKDQAGEVGKLIKNTDSWGKSVIGLEKELKEKLKTLAKLEKEAAKIFKATGQNIQGFQQWGKGTSELRKRIERLSETLNAGRERMTALKERAGALKVSIEADERAFKALQERIQETTGKELKGFQEAADKVKDSIDQKKGALVSAQGEYDNLADVVAASEGQLEQMNETLDEHKNNLGDVGEAAKDMAKDHQEATDEAAREAERLNRVWEETMGNVVASISENLTDALFEAKNFADGMKRTFKEMAKGLVQILIAELFSPLRDLMIGLGQSISKWLSGEKGGFGSLFGGVAGAGAAGGPLGLIIAGLVAATALVAKFGGAIADFTSNLPTPLKVIFPILGLIDILHNTPIEAGSKETARDFGVGVSERSIENFLPGVGLSEKQFEPIRKSILSSGKGLEQLLIPAAQAQGKVEQLIASFAQFKAHGKIFDLSGPLREAIESGNFEAYNDAWADVFANSGPLIQLFGHDYPEALGGTETALEGAGQAATQYSDELKNLAAASGVAGEDLDIFAAAMANQKGIVAGLGDAWAGFSGTIVGFGKTLQEETDLTTEQIQRLAWREFGDQAQVLAAGYHELGKELPPLLGQILDFGEGLEQAGTISDLLNRATLENIQPFGIQEDAIGGLVEMIKEWAVQTERISDISEMTQDDLNNLTQEFLNLAQAGKVAADQLSEFAAARIKGSRFDENLLDQAFSLDQTIKSWTEKSLPRFGDDIEGIQQLAWSEFGRQTQAIVAQLDAYRLDVPWQLRQVVDWGRDRGLFEGQNLPSPNLPTLPRTSLPTTRPSLSRSSGGSSRSVSSGSSSLASLSASGLMPIQKAAEQLARGQAEQVVPLLRSINQGINPDEGVETRFLPRRTVVRREEVAEIVKDLLILDEGGVREVIRKIR